MLSIHPDKLSTSQCHSPRDDQSASPASLEERLVFQEWLLCVTTTKDMLT